MGTDSGSARRSQARDAGIATVFQELSLIPDLSVASNLFYGMEPKVRAGRVDRRALRRAASAALEELGAGGIDAGRNVRDLSLGERQVLEVCKALIRDAVRAHPRRTDLGTASRAGAVAVREGARVRRGGRDSALHLAPARRDREPERSRNRPPRRRRCRHRCDRRRCRRTTWSSSCSVAASSASFPKPATETKSDEVVCEIENLASPPRLRGCLPLDPPGRDRRSRRPPGSGPAGAVPCALRGRPVERSGRHAREGRAAPPSESGARRRDRAHSRGQGDRRALHHAERQGQHLAREPAAHLYGGSRRSREGARPDRICGLHSSAS